MRMPWKRYAMQADNIKPIAIVRSYAELMDVLRSRVEQRRLSRATINVDAGLTSGYAEKLLGPSQVRHLGHHSFGALLSYLGLAIAIIKDPYSP